MDKLFGRYRRDSVAGRILTALVEKPLTPSELAKVAKPKSAANIMNPGGWYFQLRRFGKTTKKFDLSLVDGKLVLTVSKRYLKQVA